MATTNYGDISQRTAYHAAAMMLAHAEPVIVLGKFGQTKPVPRNTANKVKFRRPVPYAINTTPLVEGVTPVAHKISYEDVAVTLYEYGDVAMLTDVIADTAEDPVLNDMSMLAGENAAETIETVCYGVIKAGTNKFYGASTDSARTDVNDAISITRQHAVVRALRSNRAKPVTRMLSGSLNYGTSPIEGGYIAFAHTDLEHDIRALSGFVSVAEYGSRTPLCPEELGSVQNVRYILSPLLVPYESAGGTPGSMKSTSGSAADVYPVIFIGMDAYGHVPLAGKESITPTVCNPSTITKSDPLGQRGSVGWKTYYNAVVLNESWMAVLEVAVTAL